MDKSPDAFKTISEVAEELELPQHVLRFWETCFPQIKPLKRAGGRRYYRPDDVDLLRGIRHFLYGEGYTIKGLQRILKEDGPVFVQSVGRGGAAVPSASQRPQVRPENYSLPFQGETYQPQSPPPNIPPIEPVSAQGNLFAPPLESHPPAPARLNTGQVKLLKDILTDLEECKRVLASARRPE